MSWRVMVRIPTVVHALKLHSYRRGYFFYLNKDGEIWTTPFKELAIAQLDQVAHDEDLPKAECVIVSLSRDQYVELVARELTAAEDVEHKWPDVP